MGPQYNTPILKFYKDKTVFLTGATGFLGTVLLEKLLFATQLKKVYTLIKPMKGRNAKERLQNVFEKECFRRIKESCPDVLSKVVAIEGNICEENLGLSEESQVTLQKEVSVVIHSAASLNFDLSLAALFDLNTRASLRVLQFATTIHNLMAFVYISTAYSNVHENNDILDEKIYDLPISLKSALYAFDGKPDLAEHMADRWPNKYTFTKALSEKIIDTQFYHLPIVIVRPTVIICAEKEPVSGWIEGYNGANLVASLWGRELRVWRADPASVIDFVPVDYTAHCVLAAAWDCHNRRLNGKTDVKVFNYSSGLRNPITVGEMLNLSLSSNKTHYEKNQLPDFCIVTKHPLWLAILFFFLQTLPAYIVEAFHFLVGRKSRAMKLHKTILKMFATISYFSVNQYIMIDRNVKELFNSMDDKDKALFPFDVEAYGWRKIFFDYTYGMKKFVYKK